MIPEAAVEAALLALRQPDHWMLLDDEAKVRDLLEAAAPHMLAAAWDAAIAEADARHMIGGSDADELKDANPYRV